MTSITRNTDLTPMGRGRESVIFAVTTADFGPSVVKVPRPDFPYANTESLRREFDALSRLGSTARGADGWTFVKPLAFFDELPGYLMERVEGERFDDALVDGIARARQRQIARSLAEALGHFHRVVGSYGDFHSGNVILRGADIVLIDPTIGDPFFASPLRTKATSVEVDVGYWIFSSCARSVRYLVEHPRRVVRTMRFSKILIEEFRRDGSYDRVFEVARAHAQRLLRAERIKGPLVALPALAMIKFLELSCRA